MHQDLDPCTALTAGRSSLEHGASWLHGAQVMSKVGSSDIFANSIHPEICTRAMFSSSWHLIQGKIGYSGAYVDVGPYTLQLSMLM